jgi:hypothetical protein
MGFVVDELAWDRFVPEGWGFSTDLALCWSLSKGSFYIAHGKCFRLMLQVVV